MNDKLGGKIMKEFFGLRVKTYNYLIKYGTKDKKTKGIKECVIKKRLRFKDFKNCLEVAQLKNEINHLEKNETDVHSLKEDHKEQ